MAIKLLDILLNFIYKIDGGNIHSKFSIKTINRIVFGIQVRFPFFLTT